MSPAKVAKKVAKRIGKNTSEGCAAPPAALNAITETGINVNPEVFKTKNMIWALLAVSFDELVACSSFIALRPRGVAALSNPNILAEKFIIILPIAG